MLTLYFSSFQAFIVIFLSQTILGVKHLANSKWMCLYWRQ